MAERVGAQEVARMTGMAARTVVSRAAQGMIPSAAQLGGHWSFDPRAIRRWIKHQEAAAAECAKANSSLGGRSPKGSSGGMAGSMPASNSPDPIALAEYMRRVGRKRKSRGTPSGES